MFIIQSLAIFVLITINNTFKKNNVNILKLNPICFIH